MAAVLFDLDGVLYEGGRSIAGAAEAIGWFKDARIPHLFLTNTTSRPRSALVAKLAEYGLEIEQRQLLTPCVAARKWLKANVDGSVALFVPQSTREEFGGLDVLADDAESGAAALVLGDLGAEWNFATLNRAFRLLMTEPRPALVALGMTRYWLAPGGLQLDVAPFVAALEHATGCKAVVVGKPAAAFFEAAMQLIGEAPGAIVMVGDDIKGDIGAAQGAGLRAVLVRTGKYRTSDLEQGITPDGVLDSIATLPQWWEEHAGSLLDA